MGEEERGRGKMVKEEKKKKPVSSPVQGARWRSGAAVPSDRVSCPFPLARRSVSDGCLASPRAARYEETCSGRSEVLLETNGSCSCNHTRILGHIIPRFL